MKKIAVLALGVVIMTSSGCRMAPRLEAPATYTWEFGNRLGLDSKSLQHHEIGKQKVQPRLDWPARVAVVRVEKKTSYMPVSQDQWDSALRRSNIVESVSVLDGIGVEELPKLARRSKAPTIKRKKSGSAPNSVSGMFAAERWFATAASSDLIFLYATQVSSDTYWNTWVFGYLSLVGVPFLPAQEQAARAVSKGFLIDVKTGEVLETAGASATDFRSANPIFVMEPLHELEQKVVKEAEQDLVAQLAKKLEELHQRTRPSRTK